MGRMRSEGETHWLTNNNPVVLPNGSAMMLTIDCGVVCGQVRCLPSTAGSSVVRWDAYHRLRGRLRQGKMLTIQIIWMRIRNIFQVYSTTEGHEYLVSVYLSSSWGW